MKSSSGISLALFSLSILAFLSLSFLASITAEPVQPDDFIVTFHEEPGLDHVCFYITIKNDQGFDDSFPLKPLLNRTSIDIGKAESKLWEEESYGYQVTHCNTCEVELQECTTNNETKEEECKTFNESVTDCGKCGSWIEDRQGLRWADRQLASTERVIISQEKDANKDFEKNILKNRFEGIQIDEGKTKRYKLCYDFGEIPVNPSTGKPGSYGYMWLDVKGSIYADLKNSSWWNESYPYRYKIISNATLATTPINVNGSDAPNIWTQNGTEAKYLYCTVSGCASGLTAIGNETNETAWENASTRTGKNPTLVYPTTSLAWLHFDSADALAYDSDRHNNTFTYSSAPVKTTNAIYGKGLDFDGDDDDISYTGIRHVANFAACLWIYPKTATGGMYFEKSSGTQWSERDWYVNVEGINDTLQRWGYQFVVSRGADGQHCIISRGSPAYPLSAGQWNHLCVMRNDTGCYSFVDGVRDGAEESLSGTPRATTDRVTIADRYTGGYETNMTVDEFIYVNYSMTEAEIKTMFDNAKFSLGPEEGLTLSFSDYNRSPENPNEDQNVMVNVTINALNFDTVFLEFNNTVNWTVTTNVSSEYYHTIPSVNYTAHDNVTYVWYANNTFGNLNRSKQQSFIVANRPPSAPVHANPANNSGLALGNPVPEFNWTGTDEDEEDNITYTFVIYYQNGTPYNQTTTTNNYTALVLPTGFDETYYWQVRANDSRNISEWSGNFSFQYANWTITFNVTDDWFGGNIENVEASCTNGWDTSSFPAGKADSPFSTDDVFAPGDFGCTFSVSGYFDKTDTFTADGDETVVVEMIPTGGMTPDEHDWLEWLYNCWNSGTCKDLLEAINLTTTEISETVGDIWDQYKRTNQSVVTAESIINKTVSATSNLTISYSIDVPIKEGYTIGETSGEIRLDYLPIRISYWFLEYPNNETCYSQGNYSVALAEPYCQPLMIYTIGQVNQPMNFTVDLRPSLPSGTYTIVRNIEIDPEQVWINYGQEAIGVAEVLEDNSESMISLKNTGMFPGKTPADYEPEAASTATTGTMSPVTGWTIGNASGIIAVISVIVVLGVAGCFVFMRKRDQYQGYSYKPR